MKEVFTTKGKNISFEENSFIGEGGEALIYKLNNNTVLKMYKPPEKVLEDEEAESYQQDHIKKRQEKLLNFPKNLPKHVISPDEIVKDKNDQIVGYTMEYIENAEELRELKKRKKPDEIDKNIIPDIFRDLHYTLTDLHDHDVVIGDFNSSNVLVKDNKSYLIDADSYQFGVYSSKLYTEEYIDPLVINSKSDDIEKDYYLDYDRTSDWYAYTLMLFENIFDAHPYLDGADKGSLSPKDRYEKGISILNSDINIKKIGTEFKNINDDLLDYFIKIFEKKERYVFPSMLLDFSWTKCLLCGAEHARDSCPNHLVKTKKPASKSKIKQEYIFSKDKSTVVATAYQNNQLKFIYHHDNKYKREDGSVLFDAALNNKLKFQINGRNTILFDGENHVQFDPQGEVELRSDFSSMSSNSKAAFKITKQRLHRSDFMNTVQGIEIASSEPEVWVGEKFGIICSKNDEKLKLDYVFSTSDIKSNSNIDEVLVEGEIGEVTCSFGEDNVSLFAKIKKDNEFYNYCIVIDRSGKIKKTIRAKDRENTWLGSIENKLVQENSIISIKDNTIDKFDFEDDQNKYIDVDNMDNIRSIVSGGGGIYAATAKDIQFLKIEDHTYERYIKIKNENKKTLDKKMVTIIVGNLINAIAERKNVDSDPKLNNKCIAKIGIALARLDVVSAYQIVKYLNSQNSYEYSFEILKELVRKDPFIAKDELHTLATNLSIESMVSPAILSARLAEFDIPAAIATSQKLKDKGYAEQSLLIDVALQPTNRPLLEYAKKKFIARNDEIGDTFLKEMAIVTVKNNPVFSEKLIEYFSSRRKKGDYSAMEEILSELSPYNSEFFDRQFKAFESTNDNNKVYYVKLAMKIAPYRPELALKAITSLRKDPKFRSYAYLIEISLKKNVLNENSHPFSDWLDLSLDFDSMKFNKALGNIKNGNENSSLYASWIARALIWSQKED